MANITVHMLNPLHLADFYFTQEPEAKALSYMVEGKYVALGPIDLPFEGEEAAEEMFDISNHPRRRYQRDEIFGRCRSLSVGDIVEVDGDLFLCRPCEWLKLNVETAAAPANWMEI